MQFEKRTLEDFNIKLSKRINSMSINGKVNMIGSSNIKKIRYNSDYDIDVNLEGKDNIKDTIYKRFKKIFVLSKKDKNVYITDFKCGVNSKGDSIRWNYKEMMKGYKTVEGNKLYFTDCLMQKSNIKLDIIFLINEIYIETSDVYFLKIGDHTNYEDKTETSAKTSLSDEIKRLTKEGSYYKALKREFSILNLTDKNLKRRNKLIEYFNSDIGILNKAKSDLDLIILLLTEQNFRKPRITDIKNNIQIIKQNVSYAPELKLSNLLNEACKSKKDKLIKIVHEVINKLENYINKDTKRNFF